MEFDKSRIFTAANADEVKIGSKGYFADDLHNLELLVTGDSKDVLVLSGLEDSTHKYRFADYYFNSYMLFYLVEEPKEESEPEIKEVTAGEWDNRPRFMKVWDDDYSKATKDKVIYIAPANEDAYPVITFVFSNGTGEGFVRGYKHCAEIATKEPEAEKEYRPYRNTDEMIEDFKRRYNSYGGWSGNNNPMYCPLIWLESVHTREKGFIRYFDGTHVTLSSTWDMKELFEKFTYLDGTPVGIKE